MTRTMTILLALSLAACSASPHPSTPDRDRESRERESREEQRREKEPLTPGDEAFERALDAARKSRTWNELQIDSECQDKTEPSRFVRLYGSGVGIWDGRRQFSVSRESLLGVLGELDMAGFSGMREAVEEDEGEGEEELEITCRVQVLLDGTEKRAQEILEGDRPSELKVLADRILALGAQPGPAGLAVESLESGLEKLARGELAPEVLTLQLLRQPENPASTESGWMLRVEGGEARLSETSPGTGWSRPIRIRLSAAEVADLARALAAARPADLPANLYSSWYQSFDVGVLGRTKSVQARQFARMTPQTHGEKQERFDRLVSVLEALEARVRNAQGSSR
ncbi:MAG: hypothetical protein ABUT39_20960 [Acidobacteriota bacterium]